MIVWERRITTASVVAVAAVAAVVSYWHMKQLAAEAGEHWLSWLIPISIDGLVVAASMVLVGRRRQDQPGGLLAWCALMTGVGASLAANMASARPEPVAILLAGAAPLAFALSLELLLRQRQVTESVAPASPAPADTPPPALSTTTPPVLPPAPASKAGVDDVRQLVASGMGRAAIARELGISQHQARLAIAAVHAERGHLRVAP